MDFAHYWFQDGPGGDGGYQIDNSLRFRGAQWIAAPTSAVAGASNDYFISMWIKRGKTSSDGGQQALWSRPHGATQSNFRFNNTDQLIGTEDGNNKTTSESFRDHSAWYHICGRHSGGANGIIWVNGVELITNFRFPSAGSSTLQFGRRATENNYYFEGYMAEIHGFFNAGANIPQGLTCNNFGEFNAQGVWVPKQYTGNYDTDDYYYDFSDPADIGADRSGNGNDFTPNGFELGNTTDVNYDLFTDSPTNNYVLLNNIAQDGNLGGNSGVDFANRRQRQGVNITAPRNNYSHHISLPKSGKHFVAVYNPGNRTLDSLRFGFSIQAEGVTHQTNVEVPQTGIGGAMRFGSNANYRSNIFIGSTVNQRSTAYGNTPGDGQPKGSWVLAWDGDTRNLWMGYVLFGPGQPNWTGNIVWVDQSAEDNGLANPATGASPTWSNLDPNLTELWIYTGKDTQSSGTLECQCFLISDNSLGFNNIPAGYNWLCSNNLPAAPIPDGRDHFQAITDTGANILTAAQTAFPNGLWWIKDRANSDQHKFVDSVRGGDLMVRSPSLANESAYSAPSGNSVAWCWNAGGAAVANNDGTLETQVSANTDAGFSIMTYTGNQTSGATIGHGLSQTPEFFMVKVRTSGSTNSWAVYHQALGPTKFVKLDSAGKEITETNRWNDTAPNNTVITLGNDNSVNNNSSGHVCYAWHSVPGYSAFGTYTGNANTTDGPFIYTGFRPAFLLVKKISGSADWYIWDSTRSPNNENGTILSPNKSGVENINTGNGVYFLSNGFKITNNKNDINANDSTLLYAAFAENPYGGSNVAPANAR